MKQISTPPPPTAYRTSYEGARVLNPDLADRYIRYTTESDLAADAAIESLAPYRHDEIHQFIKAGMNEDKEVLAKAPDTFRAFIEDISPQPEWFDPSVVVPGCTAFHNHSNLFIPAFFVSTLRNATTLIAKSFHASGRVTSNFGPRRIRQNTRHFIEIMLPGAMERHGDGWKLSVRIRLVHAQLRRMIRTYGEWDESVHGVPLSQAHMALASANFSATMLRHAEQLGAIMDEEVRHGFMQIWRYASFLVGSPEELLFEGDEGMTNEFSRIAHACEPPPGEESVIVANALVQALPAIAGESVPKETLAMVNQAYRISRALLGDDIADQLSFPKQSTAGVLSLIRASSRIQGITQRVAPDFAGKWRSKSFSFLLEASLLDDLSYQLPDHLRAEKSTPW